MPLANHAVDDMCFSKMFCIRSNKVTHNILKLSLDAFWKLLPFNYIFKLADYYYKSSNMFIHTDVCDTQTEALCGCVMNISFAFIIVQ